MFIYEVVRAKENVKCIGEQLEGEEYVIQPEELPFYEFHSEKFEECHIIKHTESYE